MPQNGVAIALPRELDHQPSEIARIGDAVADAAAVIGRAMVDFEAGGQLTSATRASGGERLARVARLQLDTFGEIDFAAVARAQGKRELWKRHGATLRGLDEVKLDVAFNEIIGWVLGIADKVVADERARAH
jgi:hypothetical protein